MRTRVVLAAAALSGLAGAVGGGSALGGPPKPRGEPASSRKTVRELSDEDKRRIALAEEKRKRKSAKRANQDHL